MDCSICFDSRRPGFDPQYHMARFPEHCTNNDREHSWRSPEHHRVYTKNQNKIKYLRYFVKLTQVVSKSPRIPSLEFLTKTRNLFEDIQICDRILLSSIWRRKKFLPFFGAAPGNDEGTG